MRANIVGINLNIRVSHNLLINACDKKGFQCDPWTINGKNTLGPSSIQNIIELYVRRVGIKT
ncbi:hypothetical protein SAY86_000199 [Trapa natans]|uniref:Uncharacterized protein n=1 Tax=Trapa natans TaxID=22666 RepID=A0AAN7MXC4_TRANT|nr:hypothetical protein SAY86_000199 [Trapa natans]